MRRVLRKSHRKTQQFAGFLPPEKRLTLGCVGPIIVTMTKRKPRSDRNHAIYELYCEATGESYIGVTVVKGSALASVRGRFNRHVSRARCEDKHWLLCQALRDHGRDGFTPYLLEVVRGKAQAHERERELTHELNPALNTL